MLDLLFFTLGSSTGTLLGLSLLMFALLVFKSQLKQEEPISQPKHLMHLKRFEEIPMPPQLPIIGNMHLLKDYEHNHWDGLDMIRTKWGDIVRIKMGVLSMVMVSSKELMRECLIEKGDIFSDRPDMDRLGLIFGDRAHSLALCDYNRVHKDRRRMCRKAIIPTNMSARNQLLQRLIVQHTKSWSDDLNCKPEPEINKMDVLFLTSDLFLDFLAGETRNHQDLSYKEFNFGADYLFWEIQQSYLTDYIPILKKLGVCHSHLTHLDKISRNLRAYVEGSVFGPRLKQHQDRLKVGQSNDQSVDDEDPQNFLDSMIIDYLARASSLTLDDYKLGFADLYGGHAAVANILMLILGHLSLRPDIQDKLHDEATRARTGLLERLPDLPLSEAVVQESLRMASSPIVPHVSKEDSSLGEYFIPKKTTILFNNYYINRSKDLWDEPLQWNPLRFVDQESGELKLPAHFMPFSVGLRHCLGYKMVINISTYVTSYLCKHFYLSTNNPDLTRRLLEPKGSIAVNPNEECFKILLKSR